ncbi:MAG: methylaspartate ammonia-lyase [Actinomycetota bacterium]|jgi:methylaspartate ammonia-lyase|nr:methylaspartate ammonia-lyase [Actinomycetota bacterium]MDQ1544732.1 methylaspartate ammonia-lyase [Actinomycetota bacterium]MDQ1573199.1 methylaspartate ammonia-lyase [Actinomycetota bacterium]
MKILEVLTVPVRTGFYADDQAAIRAGASHDGFRYVGEPITPGFTTIRQPGEALSVMLLLDDGTVVYGDCAAVQYSGAGGRDPVFSSAAAADDVAKFVTPVLRGRELTGFRELTAEIDAIRTPSSELHTAIRYGVSQAILAAVAASRKLTMAEVVRDEYETGAALLPVPIYAQTGDDRYLNADKMILKGVEVLPHALINNVEEKLGTKGEILEDYLRWLIKRIGELRPSEAYHPRIHIDTYGTIGIAFGGDVSAVADYLTGLGEICAPYDLAVEHPIDAGNRDDQIAQYVELRRLLKERGAKVRLAVDEWCNTIDDIKLFVEAGAADIIHVKTPDLGGVNDTIEALLLVNRAGLEAYCGGTCNETDRSAQVSAHIAMACDASQVLAKPGMGVDEGLMIVGNEMARTAALAAIR